MKTSPWNTYVSTHSGPLLYVDITQEAELVVLLILKH